jgi:chromosome partitioning protein
MAKPTLHKELPDIARDYDVVIIDGAPRVNELARSAILASDFVLIPVQPSPFDVWSCIDIVELILAAQHYRPAIKAAFAINRKVAKSVIAREVYKAFAELPFPVLDQSISQRLAFAESAAQRRAIVETAPSSPAAWEIDTLAEFIKTTNQESKAA